jgi:hypothetical protein
MTHLRSAHSLVFEFFSKIHKIKNKKIISFCTRRHAACASALYKTEGGAHRAYAGFCIANFAW